MHANTRTHFLTATLLALAGAFLPAAHLLAVPPLPPDLTQGAAVGRKLTCNPGTTGLRGWIFNNNPS